MDGATIILVDDDKNILTTFKMRLELLGYVVRAFLDPREALTAFQKEKADVVITDLLMEGLDGQALMEEIHKLDPHLPVILFTAYGTIEGAVEAVKKGAYTYLTKPVQHEELALHVERALEKRALMKRIGRLERLVQERDGLGNIIAKSPKMQNLFRVIRQVAPTESTVSIFGESGSGKEVVARAIHKLSNRSECPFVAVNCGAIPETLLEDELFGHVKGAYTNAHRNKVGLFSQANEGTIFLDEVGETSEAMQVKLLRVLETGIVRPVGGEKDVEVNVRLVVATKQNLQQMVRDGKLREDFFYRIHVIPVYVPPLRERKEDIPLLAQHFIHDCSEKMGREIVGIERTLLERFMAYDWPGNVRELMNVIEYLVAMSSGPMLTEKVLRNSAFRELVPEDIRPLREAKDNFVRLYLEDLFRITRGNVSQAARLAGYYRADFYKLFQKHGITPRDYKGD